MSNINWTVNAFYDLVKKDKKRGYDTTATVVRTESGTAWIHIPGGVDETPAKMTIDAKPGDTVQVRVANGRAFLVGNSTAPPTDDTKADTAIKQVVETAKAVKFVQKAVEVVTRIAGNTAQYFWHTETGTDAGVHITEIPQDDFLADPENGGGNLLARSNGIAVRDGLAELAQFSANGVRIGQDTQTRSEVDYRSMKLIDREGNTYFNAEDLRDENGHYTFEFTGNGYADFALSPLYVDNGIDDVISVKVNGATLTPGTDYSMQGNYVLVFVSAPAVGASISVTIIPAADYSYLAKAYSFGIRANNKRRGVFSAIIGDQCEASGDYSMAIGRNCAASKPQSVAIGDNCSAAYDNAVAIGHGTIAAGGDQTVIGRYNVPDGTNALIIGNGIGDSNRANAIAIGWNGEITTKGTSATATRTSSATAGTLTLYRNGNLVTASGSLTVGAIGSTYTTLATIPDGFRPVAIMYVTDETGGRYRVRGNGNFDGISLTAGTKYFGFCYVCG